MTSVIERIGPQLRFLAERAAVFIAAPTAQLVIDLHDSTTRPRVALWSLCETVEAVTRFLALVAMADLAMKHDGKLPEKVRNTLAENIERPTFGVWAQVLRVVVAASKDALEVAPELPASARILDTFLRSSRSKDRPLDCDLIELRNALAHGSSTTSPVLAAKLLEVWLARLAEIIDNLTWLGDVSLWAFEPPAGWFTLQGASPDGVPAAALPCVAPFADPDAAVLQRGDAVLSLRPFGRRAAASRNPIPQIYARRGSVGLAYSLIGDEKMLQAEGPEDLITTFETLFDLEAYRAALREKGFTDLGFDTEARKDAENFIGRSDEVDALWGHLMANTEGVVSLTGVAGVGKSALMGKVADDAQKEARVRRGRGERWFVFFHRFNADDGRCAPLPFLRALYERLAAALDMPPNRDLNEQSRILDALATLLGSHSLDRVAIFLDGLDELARKEARFVERSLPRLIKTARKTLFVASYRPEAGLPELMQSLSSAPALSTGALQPFNEAECRAFIAEHLSDAVRRLIEHDEAADDGVRNRFVEELVRRSGGLPQYLVLVRKDVASGHYGKLSAADAERLPRSVEAYFQELLERYGVGDVARVRPLVTAYLAEAKEPLTIGELEALVARVDRRGRRPRKGIVASALANLGGVLRSTFSAKGQRAYELFHVDFRDFVRSSPTIADTRDDVRDVLLDGSRKPGEDETSRYFYRWGIEHLVDANLIADAISLLSDFEYQLLRLETLTPEGGDGLLRAAWSLVASNLEDPMAMPEDAFAWRQFWATEGALFEPGEGRDAALELIERALEYAPDTVVGRAATPYIP